MSLQTKGDIKNGKYIPKRFQINRAKRHRTTLRRKILLARPINNLLYKKKLME